MCWLLSQQTAQYHLELVIFTYTTSDVELLHTFFHSGPNFIFVCIVHCVRLSLVLAIDPVTPVNVLICLTDLVNSVVEKHNRLV